MTRTASEDIDAITGNVVPFDGKRRKEAGNAFTWSLDADDGPEEVVEFRLPSALILDVLAALDPNEKAHRFAVGGALRHMFKRKPKAGLNIFGAWMALSDEDAGLAQWIWGKVAADHANPAHWRGLLKKAKTVEQDPVKTAEAAERRDSAEFCQLELDLPDSLAVRVLGRGFIEFPAVSDKGAIKTTSMQNARALFDHYGARIRFNVFESTVYVNGVAFDDVELGK